MAQNRQFRGTKPLCRLKGYCNESNMVEVASPRARKLNSPTWNSFSEVPTNIRNSENRSSDRYLYNVFHNRGYRIKSGQVHSTPLPALSYGFLFTIYDTLNIPVAMRIDAMKVGIATALVCLVIAGISTAAASQSRAHEICGHPPPVADESLKAAIEGQAQLLARMFGDVDLKTEIESAKSEIFSQYPDAERTRSNSYFEYQACVLIMDDETLETRAKLDELIRIRTYLREPRNPREEQSSIQGAPLKDAQDENVSFSLKKNQTKFLFKRTVWMSMRNPRSTVGGSCVHVTSIGEDFRLCVGQYLEFDMSDGKCRVIYIGPNDDQQSADFTVICS